MSDNKIVKRYSDDELLEFKEIILNKLAQARESSDVNGSIFKRC